MALLSDFIPTLGAPDRRTILTRAAFPSGGTHAWLSGARLARVVVVGAGGGGGATGKYLSSGTYYYNAGGGGSAGELVQALLMLDPASEVGVAFVIGAGAAAASGGASYFGSYLHAGGGAAGQAGSAVATNTPGIGGAEVGIVTSTIYGTGTIRRPRYPNTLPGQGGSNGINGGAGYGGPGGGTLYGKGAPANTNPVSGAPVAGSAPSVGYGGGASGGSWAPSTATNYTIPAGPAGADGVIIVEEWL